MDYISGQTDKFFLKECETQLNGLKIGQLQKKYKYAKITNTKEEKGKLEILTIIYILILIIIGLVVFSVMQIKAAGMKVKDFAEFIQANQILDDLYELSKKYDKMNSCDKLVFLMEAEKVFSAFDKIPNMLWEDEYQKYTKILDIYRDIKIVRWNEE